MWNCEFGQLFHPKSLQHGRNTSSMGCYTRCTHFKTKHEIQSPVKYNLKNGNNFILCLIFIGNFMACLYLSKANWHLWWMQNMLESACLLPILAWNCHSAVWHSPSCCVMVHNNVLCILQSGPGNGVKFPHFFFYSFQQQVCTQKWQVIFYT